MARKVLAAANNQQQKYYIEENFGFLPDAIKEDLKKICVYMAEKLNCTFVVGFEENGDLYFETVKHEGDCDFDDIGAELEIKKIQKEELELFRAIELWYVIFCTKEGEPAKQELMRRAAEEGKTL
ncbi:DUF6145 family protein [Anaerotignum sp.]